MATYQIDGKIYNTSIAGLYIDDLYESHYYGETTVAYSLEPVVGMDYDGLFKMDPCWSSVYNRAIFIETKADPLAEDEVLFEPTALVYTVYKDDRSVICSREVMLDKTEKLMLTALMATKDGNYKAFVLDKQV